jgi:hypothetical protein
MTYIIVKEKTYINGTKLFSVHDQAESDQVASRKVRGYNLASDEDTRFVSCYIDNEFKTRLKLQKIKTSTLIKLITNYHFQRLNNAKNN